MADLTGLEATLTLAAALGLFLGRRPTCHRIAAELRWWADARRADAEWRAVSDQPYRVELAAAAAEHDARRKTQDQVSASRAPDARALRPVGTPIDILRDRP